jgi:hypothetical protein
MVRHAYLLPLVGSVGLFRQRAPDGFVHELSAGRDPTADQDLVVQVAGVQ